MAVNQQLPKRSGGQSSSKFNEEAMTSRLMRDKNQAKSAADSNSSAEPEVDLSRYSTNFYKRKSGDKSDPASASSALAKINDGTSKLLQGAWENILWSLGLTIIWIDIHVFFSMITPKMFCKLGHEWVPSEIKKTAPKQAAMQGEKIAVVENGACCCINGACGIIVISAIVVAGILVSIYDSAFGKILFWFPSLFQSLFL